MNRRELEEVKVRIKLLEIERKDYRINDVNNSYYLELSLRLWKLQAKQHEIERQLAAK